MKNKQINCAVERSLKQGKRFYVGNREYCGKPPQFITQFNELGMPIGYLKSKPGIPFVKTGRVKL